MNSKEKKLIIVLVLITIAVSLTIMLLKNNMSSEKELETAEEDDGKYVVSLSDGTKLNVSEDLNSIKKYKDLEISNVQYTEYDGQCVLLADVTNKGSDIHKLEEVNMKIIGENGDILTEMKSIIGEINPGETIKLNVTITASMINIKDFVIEELE